MASSTGRVGRPPAALYEKSTTLRGIVKEDPYFKSSWETGRERYSRHKEGAERRLQNQLIVTGIAKFPLRRVSLAQSRRPDPKKPHRSYSGCELVGGIVIWIPVLLLRSTRTSLSPS